MKICVLQPSYEGSTFDYRHYDTPRDLSPLRPDDTFHHEFLNKRTTFKQIRALHKQGFDIYVNLCEGYLDSDIPSIDVILALEYFNLPYTGPRARLYDPPKDLMKLVATLSGVAVPRYLLADTDHDIEIAAKEFRFPLFVKPHASGDSLGIDRESYVTDTATLRRKAAATIQESGKALIEEYIAGREFTVLVYAEPDATHPAVALLPVEFRFPPGEHFKTYDLKVRQYHPECNHPCREPGLAGRLKEAACRIFRGFSGEGYARMDFRVTPDNQILFLEVNFACSVFYPAGYYGSADYILMADGLGHSRFLDKIIAEGLARHAWKQKPFAIRSSNTGIGMFATRAIARGEVVVWGEGQPHRIMTRSQLEQIRDKKEILHRCAFPISKDVLVLWDKDPAGWILENHSCEPNTAFAGLDIIALRDIGPGEELTIDYSAFCDSLMSAFDCRCGSPKCRGRIVGRKDLFS